MLWEKLHLYLSKTQASLFSPQKVKTLLLTGVCFSSVFSRWKWLFDAVWGEKQSHYHVKKQRLKSLPFKYSSDSTSALPLHTVTPPRLLCLLNRTTVSLPISMHTVPDRANTNTTRETCASRLLKKFLPESGKKIIILIITRNPQLIAETYKRHKLLWWICNIYEILPDASGKCQRGLLRISGSWFYVSALH